MKITPESRKVYNAVSDWLTDWEYNKFKSPQAAFELLQEMIAEWGEQWVNDEQYYLDREAIKQDVRANNEGEGVHTP